MKNRQFKFRIWDKESKRWLNKNDSSLHCFSDWQIDPFTGKISDFVGSISGVSDSRSKYSDFKKGKFVIQQFTGLQDSVGKDCYEGDILELCGPEDFNHHYGLVEFKDGAFIMNGSNRGLTGWLKWGEIKANILENPELLK